MAPKWTFNGGELESSAVYVHIKFLIYFKWKFCLFERYHLIESGKVMCTKGNNSMAHFAADKNGRFIGAPWLRTKVCLPKVEIFSICLRTKDSLPKN